MRRMLDEKDRENARQMVDLLIKKMESVKPEAIVIPGEKIVEFDKLLGKAKGTNAEPLLKPNEHWSPQKLLLAADKCGLVTGPYNEGFMGKYGLLLKLESSLLYLRHLFPKEVKEYFFGIQNMPIRKRWGKLHKLCGLNFSSLVRMHEEVNRLMIAQKIKGNPEQKIKIGKMQAELKEMTNGVIARVSAAAKRNFKTSGISGINEYPYTQRKGAARQKKSGISLTAEASQYAPEEAGIFFEPGYASLKRARRRGIK